MRKKCQLYDCKLVENVKCDRVSVVSRQPTSLMFLIELCEHRSRLSDHSIHQGKKERGKKAKSPVSYIYKKKKGGGYPMLFVRVRWEYPFEGSLRMPRNHNANQLKAPRRRSLRRRRSTYTQGEGADLLDKWRFWIPSTLPLLPWSTWGMPALKSLLWTIAVERLSSRADIHVQLYVSACTVPPPFVVWRTGGQAFGQTRSICRLVFSDVGETWIIMIFIENKRRRNYWKKCPHHATPTPTPSPFIFVSSLLLFARQNKI